MNDTTRIPAPEIEAVKAAYAALNRNDIAGFVRTFADDIERIEFEGLPMAGTYRGIVAVTEHVKQGRSTWAEGTCEPEKFVVFGNMVVVIASVHVRLKGRSDWLDGRTGDVFTFRDGKVVQFRTFAEPEAALEWADANH